MINLKPNPKILAEKKIQQEFAAKLQKLLVNDGAVDNTPNSVYGWLKTDLKPQGYSFSCLNVVNGAWLLENEQATANGQLTVAGLAATIASFNDVSGQTPEGQEERQRIADRLLLLFTLA